jgi:hypothetical protein
MSTDDGEAAVSKAPRGKRIRYAIGASFGWIGLIIALTACYLNISFAFQMVPAIPSDRGFDLGLPGFTNFVTAIAAAVICGVCGLLCIVLQSARLKSIMVCLLGVGLALASWPLGTLAIKFVVAKYHLVPFYR